MAIAAFAPGKIIEACVAGVVGNRTDAALTALGKGLADLTGKAEHNDVLAAMQQAFTGSIEAMSAACERATTNPQDALASRSLQQLVASRILTDIRLDNLPHPLALLDDQVRAIYGRQGKEPRQIATDNVIALVNAAIGTPLTPALTAVFHHGHIDQPGWAQTFENLFSRDVQRKAELFRILMLDRVNEIASDVKVVRREVGDAKDEILAAIAALARHSEGGGATPMAAIETLEQALAQDQLSPSDIDGIARFYGDFLKRTTTIPAALVSSMVRDLSASGDPMLVEAALRNMAGADRQSIVVEMAAELDDNVATLAARYRDLAALAALDSTALARSLYAKAVDLDPTDALTWIRLSNHHRHFGDGEAALATARQALQHAATTGLRIRSHAAIGDALIAKGSVAEAKGAYQAGFALAQELQGRSPEDAGEQRSLAIAYDRFADLTLAEGTAQDALVTRREALRLAKALAEAEPDKEEYQIGKLWAELSLADVLRFVGQLEEARGLYDRLSGYASARLEKQPGSADWSSLLCEALRGQANDAGDRLDRSRCIAIWERIFAIRKNLSDAQPQVAAYLASTARAAQDLAACLSWNSDFQAALEKCETAAAGIAEALTHAPGNAHYRYDQALILLRCAHANVRCNRPELATACWQQAENLARELVHQNHVLRRTRTLLADILVGHGWHKLAGRQDGGKSLVEEALEIQQELARQEPDTIRYEVNLASTWDTLAAFAEGPYGLEGALACRREAVAWASARADMAPGVATPAHHRAILQEALAADLGAVGETAEALDLLQAALLTYRELADVQPENHIFQVALAANHRNRAGVHAWLGDHPAMLACFSDAAKELARAQQLSPASLDVLEEAVILSEWRGDAALGLDDPVRAAEHYAAAVYDLERMRDAQPGIVWPLQGLLAMRERDAEVAANLGDLPSAIAILTDCARQWERLSSQFPFMASLFTEYAAISDEVAEAYRVAMRQSTRN